MAAMPAAPASRESGDGSVWSGSIEPPSAAGLTAAATPSRGVPTASAALWLDQGAFLIIICFQAMVVLTQRGNHAGPAAVLAVMLACLSFVLARPQAYWRQR